MTAVTLHLDYLASSGLCTVLFALPLAARRLVGWNEIFTFWFAYVITRPLGASIADWFGMPQYVGGLDINKALVAGVLTVFIAVFVGYFAVTRSDVQPAPVE